MTTLIPRPSYSREELDKLYPKELELQLVQILLRHGERSPVSPRFQNTGLQPYWPYCNSARQLTSVIRNTKDFSQWDQLKYRRRLETFGAYDSPVIAAGPQGEFDAICQPGELTDKGRDTTLALGQRLRHLYVDQLDFMPKLIASSDMIYLRATPIPRALESVQQAFSGFYPPSARTADFPPPTIITRTPADETLYPNDASCRRFAKLSRAFAQRTAERWNDTEDMEYLSKLFSKWMPGKAKVAVDSHPRLSGIMDTLNATDAHGPETKLPKEFYTPKARAIIDKIAVEEWFQGYNESAEYRMLGSGGLMGDITSRMTGSVERNGNDGLVEIGGNDGELGKGRGGETDIKFALSGCHDTTLAGVLTSLGAFDGENWPPFTSHIAFELFSKRAAAGLSRPAPTLQRQSSSKNPSWWSSLFGSTKPYEEASVAPEGISRKPITELTQAQREALQGYYVRIRYNDKIMQVPGCKPEGKHLDGDTTFCTLEAFKSIVDKYTPKNWKAACTSRLDEPAFPDKPEPAGYE
ncbi:phosphoglycerate mutase-like protein [Cucurbitaria berberidis CBS 394.84]|uniref:3-phytase n=1 Tax=Cucurbitaria berberidis CBS 394.84 TaxID=1168544 RepID=A0A9P4L6T2_9PLEO|nr:phosphoglycerate mutase-like protein [Cucurbitaria berberidis CBS 394.84]KAF1844296.1 phosphoglycerate mutase-like protein [Cucurbitaria berberidis CBS 394.84]